MRGYKFAALNAKEQLQPTSDQLKAAEDLVDALDLAQGTRGLFSEHTPVPNQVSVVFGQVGVWSAMVVTI